MTSHSNLLISALSRQFSKKMNSSNEFRNRIFTMTSTTPHNNNNNPITNNTDDDNNLNQILHFQPISQFSLAPPLRQHRVMKQLSQQRRRIPSGNDGRIITRNDDAIIDNTSNATSSESVLNSRISSSRAAAAAMAPILRNHPISFREFLHYNIIYKSHHLDIQFPEASSLLSRNVSYHLGRNLSLATLEGKLISSASGSILDLDIDTSEMRYLMSISVDLRLRVYDLESSLEKEQQHMEDMEEEEESMETTRPSRKRKRNPAAGSATMRRPIVEKNLATAATTQTTQQRSRRQLTHRYAVSSLQWYPVDTGIFITGSFDHTVRVWDTNRMESVRRCRFKEKVYKIAMSGSRRRGGDVSTSASSTLVAVGGGMREVSCLDLRTGTVALQLLGHREGCWALDWHPINHNLLVSGSLDGTIRLWDIRKVGMLQYYDMNHTKRSKKSHPLFGRFSTDNFSSKTKVPKAHGNGGVTSLQFTNDGTRLLSAGMDETLRLWDAGTAENTLTTFEGVKNKHQRSHRFAFDHDDNFVYFPVQNKIHVYDLETGELLDQLEGHFSFVNSCVFHPRDMELYSGGADHQTLVYAPAEEAARRKEALHEQMSGVLRSNGSAGGNVKLPGQEHEENWSDSDDDIWQ